MLRKLKMKGSTLLTMDQSVNRKKLDTETFIDLSTY